jgi:putative intracellular protease/amidase
MTTFRLWSLFALLALAVAPLRSAGPIDPPAGAVIVLVGGGQGERLLRDPAFEAELQRRRAGRGGARGGAISGRAD